jgi:hypothetical protein
MPATDFQSANLAIVQAYAAMRAKLGEDAQANLDSIVGETVPPAKVANFFELAYAQADKLDDATKATAADVGHFAWSMGFYGLADNQRGQLMEAVLRGQTLPSGATAPDPKPEYSEAPAPAVDVAMPKTAAEIVGQSFIATGPAPAAPEKAA